ncbi:muconolactone Delta-isomerase family protein [Chloroflexota bacterium]
MKYLVTMDLAGGPPTGPPQQAVQWMEQSAIPQLEAMVKLEAEKKILAGGGVVGQRGSAYVIEAQSGEELDRLLWNLPSFGVLRIDVTPLVSFETRLEESRQKLQAIKAAMK